MLTRASFPVNRPLLNSTQSRVVRSPLSRSHVGAGRAWTPTAARPAPPDSPEAELMHERPFEPSDGVDQVLGLETLSPRLRGHRDR